MVTVLLFTSEQFLNPITMFPVKGSFEMGLFGQISKHVLWIELFREQISYEGHI